MFYDNTCEHNGYFITGHAFELAPDRWQAQLLVERNGFVSVGIGISPVCPGARLAEQQALVAGRRMVDSNGFGMLAASGLA